MDSATCPFCGDLRIGRMTEVIDQYNCGTEIRTSGSVSHRGENCKIRCELAALRTRHQRLVEAAGKVALHINSTDIDFDYFKKTLQDLAKVIETETSNETKPSERGCPFDEAMESEAKQ